MKLKKYFDFINEELDKKDIQQYKTEIKGLDNIIADALGMPSMHVRAKTITRFKRDRSYEYSHKPTFENNHDMFVEIFTYTEQEETLESVERKILDIIPFVEVYDIQDPDRNKSKVFYASYNLEEFLRSDLAKSIVGINKFKL